MDHRTNIRKHLASLCESWGGELIRLRPKEFDEIFHRRHEPKDPRGHVRTGPESGYYNAPFTHERLGINWQKKQVIYAGPVLWPGIIHEMGHVFNDRTYEEEWDIKKKSDNEMDWFGWEYLMTKKVGGPVSIFYDHNEHYGVEWEDEEQFYSDFGQVREAGRKVLKPFLDYAIGLSIQAGCVTDDFELKVLRQ